MKKFRLLIIVMIISILLSQVSYAIPSLMMNGYTDTPKMQYVKLEQLSEIIRSTHYNSGFNDTPMRNAYELYIEEKTDISSVELRNELLKLLEDENFYNLFANLMLQQYDKNSYLLDEDVYMSAYQMDHDYEGYGFQMREYGPFFIVTNIYPNSGAERSGLVEGDIIVKANSTDLRFKHRDFFSAILSDSVKEKGEIELTCFNENSPELRKVIIKSSIVNIPDIECEVYDNTAILKISMFNSKNFYAELADAAEVLNDEIVSNVIIDLRDNPGGYIDYCLKTIDLFIDDAGVMMMGERTRASSEYHYTTGAGKEFDKVYVLVNEGSASSAEILAASLRDNIGAELIGAKTYGKCYGQATLLLDDKFLVITTSEAVLPKTKNYDHIGLKPDVNMEIVPEYYDMPELTELDIDKKITSKSSSEQILALEERLSLLKYLSSEPDGVFDDDTIAALNALQNQLDLTRSSNCSAELAEMLEAAMDMLSKAEELTDNQIEYALSQIFADKAA